MSDLACRNCTWWVSRERVPRNNHLLQEGFGECRRRAPTGMSVYVTAPINDGGSLKTSVVGWQFAPTADDDFCGEWADRDA